ncbi:ATP-binding protein [Microvirga vignae]|uniref:ATP-binding protein n=1 Tax=Microvirga vignae TaxID=1225564 RepID=UPI000B036DCC|nr:ATP-binding protein [Microvirga vignae]
MDRHGAAVGTITSAKERALRTLCDLARESLTPAHFDARFAEGGNAGPAEKAVRADMVALLNDTKGSLCTSEEVHRFLAHFVLIRFDFLREGAADPPEAINRIRDCLIPGDAAKAPLIWSRMVQLARASAGKAGQFDRPRLVRSIAQVARLRGATSLQDDLDNVSALAKSYAELIQDDVGGTKLERPTLLAELDSKLNTARLVQVRGLPGSGKSVLMRRAVQRSLKDGPTLFLKAEQLEGTSWISYAASQGMSSASLEHLLVEIGAAGTPILFIDAIDRVEKEHQPVVLDVIRTVVQSPLLGNWRIVVSLRDTEIEILRNWLGDVLALAKVETLGVDALNDDEAELLANAKPHLRSLLFGTRQVKAIVRRPFFAKVLNQSFIADPRGPSFTPQSEIDLIENWWKRGGYNASGQSAVERQRAILDLATVRARQLSQPIRLSQLKSVAHIDDLRTDGILQDARAGHSVRFAHDIFFERAFFHVLADQASQWLDEIRACGEPPAVARVVELLSQWEYTEDQNWGAYLAQAETSGLRSQWMRAWLVGPLGSAKFEVAPERFATAVYANDFRLLEKVLVWFQSEKTIPNPTILAGNLPQEQRQRFADLLGWPSDFAAWRRLITFILARLDEIPSRLYPEIVAVFEIWQNALWDYPNPISKAIISRCAEWLREIDCVSSDDVPTPTSSRWHQVPDFGDFRRRLSALILTSSRTEPELTTEYLERVIRADRMRSRQFEELVGFSGYLARSHPQLLVELTLAHLTKELPDDQVARERKELQKASERSLAALGKPESERTRIDELGIASGFSIRSIGEFSYHDWERLSIDEDTQNFWPPSPLREPFHALFQSAPADALRLLRGLCNHAMTAWRQLHRHSRDRGGTPHTARTHLPMGHTKVLGRYPGIPLVSRPLGTEAHRLRVLGA